MTNYWVAMLAILTVLATPGPTNTLLLTASATGGLRRALPLLTAELPAYLVTVNLVGLALRPVMAATPWIGVLLRLVLAVYLAFAAVRLWRKPRLESGHSGAVRWRDVFVATLLNPKGMIFALVILPFGSPELPSYLGSFCGLVVTMGACWLVIGSLLGRIACHRRRFAPRIASVALAGFSALVAASTLA